MSTSRYAKESLKDWETVLWQGLGIQVPGDWEILRFRRAYDSGFLLWAGRYGYQFQLSWQRRSSARNVDEVCRDFIGKSRIADASQTIQRMKDIGSWSGVAKQYSDRREGRYFRILPNENCLLEAVIVDRDSEDPDVIASLLQSIFEVAKGKENKWKAFGLEFEVPICFKQEKCEVLPASAIFEFTEAGEQPIGLTFGRTGMVRHWLKADLSDWWNTKWAGREGRIKFATSLRRESVTVYLEERHLPQKGAFSRIRPIEKVFSCLWVDPVDGRVYQHVLKCVGRNRRIDYDTVGSLKCRDRFNTRDLMKEHFHG